MEILPRCRRTARRDAAGFLAVLCLVGGCATSDIITDNSRFSVRTGLHRALPSQHANLRVPAGTELCLELGDFYKDGLWRPNLGGPLGGPCYDIVALDALDALADEGPCFVLEDPGPARFRLEPDVNCEPLGSVPADTFTVEVRPLDPLRARIVPGLDAQALHTLVTLDGQPLPAELLPPQGEPMRVVAGSTVWIAPLLLDADDEPVAFRLSPSARSLNGIRGSFEDLSGSLEDLPAEEILVRLGARSEVTVSVTIPGRTLEAGALVSVPQSDAASLTIQGAVAELGDNGGFLRAVVRDANGGLLFGSDVAWSVEGTPVGLGAMAELGGSDYAYFSDVCLPPPESPTARSIVLTASLGDLTDSLTYSWIAQPDPEAREAFEPSELCPPPDDPQDDPRTERGCGCSHDDHGFVWLVALMGVALARRRSSDALTLRTGAADSPRAPAPTR